MTANGDRPLRFNDLLMPTETETVRCSGFTHVPANDEQSDFKCTNTTPKVLSLGPNLYFCDAAHLLKYLIIKFTAKRGGTKRKKQNEQDIGHQN